MTPWELDALSPIWQARIGVLIEGYMLAGQDLAELAARESAAKDSAARLSVDPYEEIIVRE